MSGNQGEMQSDTLTIEIEFLDQYETLAKRGELVALEVKDIDLLPDGTGQALIRRGKTDEKGQGRMAYLSRETVRWLKLGWSTQVSIKGRYSGG